VRAEPLSSGLEGLGLASGRSARLRLGDAEYVGAAAARCGGAGGGTLEGRLAARAGRQRWVNEERRRAAEEQRSTHDMRVLFGHVTVHSREVRRAPLFAPIGKQSVVNVQATCTKRPIFANCVGRQSRCQKRCR
jgi:hypothetical protein